MADAPMDEVRRRVEEAVQYVPIPPLSLEHQIATVGDIQRLEATMRRIESVLGTLLATVQAMVGR